MTERIIGPAVLIVDQTPRDLQETDHHHGLPRKSQRGMIRAKAVKTWTDRAAGFGGLKKAVDYFSPPPVKPVSHDGHLPIPHHAPQQNGHTTPLARLIPGDVRSSLRQVR